ncbi:MAG: zf-HC2 domain-containing protein, partial [Chloroflexota bacterium]
MSDPTRTEHALDPALLSGYYDEALDDDERREVENHLARCSACRERLAGYATMGGALRAGATTAAPPTLDEKVERLFRRYSSSRLIERPRAASRARPPRQPPDRRWPVWSAVAAVVVLGLLAGTFFFGLPFGGGGIGPTVAAAYPCDDPTQCAIAVRFDGSVDHSAVERSFRIDPPVPVTFTWQDNDTLFVKPKQPLQSAATYTVSIQPDASAPGLAIPILAKPTPVALHFVAGAAGAPVAMASLGRSASAFKAASAPTARPSASPPGASSGSETPASTPTEPAGTPTAAAAVPAAATSPCSIQPVRGFGTLYRDQPKVAARLGCARAPEAGLSLVVEPFQHGQMIWLGDRRQIVALLDTGHWSEYPDTYTGTETVTPGPGEPIHGFGKIWRETPTLHDAIGAATAPEQASAGAIEDFDHGTLVWTTDRIIYTLYSDGTWEKYPDTFVDVTPIASAVATGSPSAGVT